MELKEEKRVVKTYRIWNLLLKIDMPEDVSVPENFQKFEMISDENPVEADVCYYFEYTDEIQTIAEKMLAQRTGKSGISRENIEVFYTEKGECRFTKLWYAPLPYGICQQEENGRCHIWYEYGMRDMLPIDTIFCSLFCLEKYALSKGGIILHSAFMCYNDTSVLFSAPSGVGKSTQAALWETYRHTRTINGDRSLLTRQDGKWFASGWPVCGSSEICFNEAFPVRAIVMLKQAKENRVSRLKGLAAFRAILAEITINSWDREFQEKAISMIEQLLSEVPVYLLECDISEEAVVCLENSLQKEEQRL